MPINTDFKLIREKRIDKETVLRVSKKLSDNRIFVEFVSDNPRMVLQRNFPDGFFGKLESEKFSKSINSSEELREYFGIKKRSQ
jgi:hypothetical protein